jgi:hypothetical protein
MKVKGQLARLVPYKVTQIGQRGRKVCLPPAMSIDIGNEYFVSVEPDGTVILRPYENLTEAEQQRVDEHRGK